MLSLSLLSLWVVLQMKQFNISSSLSTNYQAPYYFILQTPDRVRAR